MRESEKAAISTLYTSVDAVQEGKYTWLHKKESTARRNDMPELAEFPGSNSQPPIFQPRALCTTSHYLCAATQPGDVVGRKLSSHGNRNSTTPSHFNHATADSARTRVWNAQNQTGTGDRLSVELVFGRQRVDVTGVGGL